jgi:GNAT superfamily N-acetyltransferase
MSTDEDSPQIVIEPADPLADESQGLLSSYFDEVKAAFGYTPEAAAPADPEEFVPPGGLFLVLREADGTPRGCGGVRLLDAETAEVKRMWLDPAMRGRGAGWALLRALETEAVSLGARRGVLDTNATLTSALALYRAAGWVEVEAYNDNSQATHWFSKDLAAAG